MVKAKRVKSLAEQIAALDEPKPFGKTFQKLPFFPVDYSNSQCLDFDPEAIDDRDDSDNDEEEGSDDGSADEAAAREHYVNVAKSKLRKGRDPVSLGPQYAGSRVSRDALEADDDSDDPFAKDFSGEDSEAGTEESNDEEEEEVSEDQFEEELDDSIDEDEEEDEEEEDDEDEDEENGGVSLTNGTSDDIDREKLRKIMQEESKAVAATISVAAKADADKGRAVKVQRKTFDSVLNARIRLQKALIAANTFSTLDGSKDESDDSDDTAAVEAAYKSAETAALALLDNVTKLREALDSARTGSKRKSSVAFSEDSSSAHIWSYIQSSESSNLTHRNAILEKWSSKSKPTQVSAPSRRLNSNAASGQQSLTSVLQSHLSDSARLIEKTQMPRSCAPTHKSASVAIYDDADFYGLLLKELLEQRSAEMGSSIALPSLDGLSAQYKAAREAKTKKIVDTRASKGRKLRYTVHEKLQNYMAPEDRGSWGNRQVDELFGSLLGRKLALEEDVVSEDDEDMEDQEAGGLALFRS